MQFQTCGVHVYGPILLLLAVPCVSAARVRSKAANKDLDEEVYVPPPANSLRTYVDDGTSTSRFGENSESDSSVPGSSVDPTFRFATHGILRMPAWDRHLRPMHAAAKPGFGMPWRNQSRSDSAAFMAEKSIIVCASALLPTLSARLDSIGGVEPALVQVSESTSPFELADDPEPMFDVNSEGKEFQDKLAAVELKRIRSQTRSLTSQLAKVKAQLQEGQSELIGTGEMQNLTLTYAELVSLKLEGAQLLEKVNTLIGLALNVDKRAANRILEARFQSLLAQTKSETGVPAKDTDDEFWENNPDEGCQSTGAWSDEVPSD